MYEIDSTFNTNRLRLPLSDIVGIDNTGKTFPVAFCYITSESAASFAWISEQLSEYVFYDCPEPALIIGDFAKGLGAADLSRKEVTENKSRQTNDSGFQRLVKFMLKIPMGRERPTWSSSSCASGTRLRQLSVD